MLRFVGVKELDRVCLVSPVLIRSGKLTLQYILLLDGVQFGIVVADDTGQEMEMSHTGNRMTRSDHRTYVKR